MREIHIPEALFDDIRSVLPAAASADDFIRQAIREKLSSEARKREFQKIAEETRAAMKEKGLTEADILADFESSRGT